MATALLSLTAALLHTAGALTVADSALSDGNCVGEYRGKRQTVGACRSAGGSCCAYVPGGQDGYDITDASDDQACSFCFISYLPALEVSSFTSEDTTPTGSEASSLLSSSFLL
ncbi:hypothetical protein IWQ60_000631 [Tieghemiomyces parasiticus]|uniref:Uncharacterized protein n=1 Tax=Tieghemiomyces parasiticus TaxID=78921 RepID=A0A9W8DZ18_9FUNG|nr:hypothetical protein IWQ60_000631 [Tieghemiomyces parasiticus]